MTAEQLAFGRRVLWTNAAGAIVAAQVVDILHGKNQVQIRVTNPPNDWRLVRLFWVHPETLQEVPG